jgi:hypothetical protein
VGGVSGSVRFFSVLRINVNSEEMELYKGDQLEFRSPNSLNTHVWKFHAKLPPGFDSHEVVDFEYVFSIP